MTTALLGLLIILSLANVHSTNFTQEDLFDELLDKSWDENYQINTIGTASPILKGRGMVTEFRIRPSGSRNFFNGRSAGIHIFLRQAVDGELGKWRETTFLVPDDLPTDADPLAPSSTVAFYCGAFSSKGFDDSGVLGNRDGVRLQTNKHTVGGNPETGNVLMVSAFGYTYTETAYTGEGAAYVFTGEYYHWTQSTKLRAPTNFVTVDDDEYHFGRCVSIDKQTMDTAAISCSGCDPGKYKTALVSGEADGIGSQGRGAVFIYKGNEKTGFKQWTATQMLWPRHNKWYYFGGGFVTADGNTLITDACKGAKCTSNAFENREYDSPMTDLFVYVKQEATGLWSEQQVLTDPLMESNVHAKDFDSAVLHDDTIAIGIGLTHSNLNKYKKDVGKFSGQVLIFYPNLPHYEIAETFRHQAGIKSRKDNSYRLNKHQWSLHQLLESENPMSRLGGGSTSPWREYFGKYISISGDRMAIAMKGTSWSGSSGNNAVTALFERPRQGGLWSQQQILIDTNEMSTETYGINLYNSHFVMTSGKRFYKYMSEQAHGKWSCLLVSMFDEFGDGWDGAKLRVDAPDGSYDYFYPTCDVPTAAQLDMYQNPFQFQYCPSMKQQGGMYTFYIVDGEDAKFNWELEWQIDNNLANWRLGFIDMWGNSTDRYVGNIHTRMQFYWNPITLSFEEGPSEDLVSPTVTCTSCPARGSTHRHLESGDTDSDRDIEVEDESLARSLLHAAKTASPTVSPAPTMAQSDSALAEWEQLVMTTSDPLRPWFRADRTGTYFYLSDLEGKNLLRHITQCPGSATPLTHSCWVNFPDSIPDGDYIARIGGARAGINKGLHTWHFCGIAGSQSEHLQFRVQHGSCYPVQRFTTSRYCSFKEGSTVIADLPASFGIALNHLTPAQERKIFKVLSELLPHTHESDFSISNQRIDDSSHLHATLHVKLRVSDYGFDPADFDAVSNLEASFSQYIYKASEKGILANALANAVGSSSAEDVSVDVVAFDTGFTPKKALGVVDDDASEEYPEEMIEKDWLKFYAPASQWDRGVLSALSATTDVMAVLGYIGILVCVALVVKQARVRYRASQAVLQRDLESASETLLQAKESAVSSGGSLVSKVHSSLDSFSDNVYALLKDKKGNASESRRHAGIPDIVFPKLDTLFVGEDNKKSQIRHTNKVSDKASEDFLYASSSESSASTSSSSSDDESAAYTRR